MFLCKLQIACRASSFAALLALILLPSADSRPLQETEKLSNESVVALVKSGLGKETIVELIKSRPGSYQVGVTQVIQLREAGVPDEVLSAMVQKSTGPQLSPPPQSTPQSPPPVPVALQVPEGLVVNLRVSNEVSSANAAIGDQIDFSVAEDVYVKGFVVISKGAKAVGKVAEAESGGKSGRSGKLVIDFDYVLMSNGRRLALGSTKEGNEQNKGAFKKVKTKQKRSASVILLGGFGGAAARSGSDVVLEQGTLIVATTVESASFSPGSPQ